MLRMFFRARNNQRSPSCADGCTSIGQGIVPGEEPHQSCAWLVRITITELVRNGKDPGSYDAAERRKVIQGMYPFAGRKVDPDYIANCFNWANDQLIPESHGMRSRSASVSASEPAWLDQTAPTVPDPHLHSFTTSEPAETQGRSSLAISEDVRTF